MNIIDVVVVGGAKEHSPKGISAVRNPPIRTGSSSVGGLIVT